MTGRAAGAIHWVHGLGAARLEAGTTVVADDAGMLDTADLYHLTQLAEVNSWRLVLVGDPHQLQAVGRGGMFHELTVTGRVHELDRIHRFTEPWQAEASLALRRGDPDAARAYVDHGRVQTLHPALVTERIAQTHQRVTSRGRTVAITTSSAATARAINEEIQWQRHRRRPRGPSIPLADGTELHLGDQIATRRNHPGLVTDTGIAVRNRHTWIVTAIHADGGIAVTDDTHGTVTLPPDYVAEHVELGWAVTGYGNQGITADHAICVIEPGTTRAGVYVGLTRGRDRNTAIILDPTGTADPEEALARAITRPANATTAHAARDRLHRAQGLEPPTTDVTRPATDIDIAAQRMLTLLDQHAADVRQRPPLSRGL